MLCVSTRTRFGWEPLTAFSPLTANPKRCANLRQDQGDLSANGILALVADPQQECLWIGTSGGGVLKYDGRTFQSIRLGKAALENIVDAILRDSRGRLWFGTRAGLIAYQPGETPPRIRIRQVVARANLG